VVRPALAGYLEALPEPGYQVQSAFDRLPHGLDPEAIAQVEQPAAVRDSQGGDFLWPDLIRAQHDLDFCGQPLHRHHLSSTSVGTYPQRATRASRPLVVVGCRPLPPTRIRATFAFSALAVETRRGPS